MEHEEIKQILRRLTIYGELKETLLEEYVRIIQKHSYTVVNRVIDNIIKENPYAPKPAELAERIQYAVRPRQIGTAETLKFPQLTQQQKQERINKIQELKQQLHSPP